MKKALLLIAFVVTGLCASAQDRIDLTPGYAYCTYDASEQHFGEGWYKMKLVFKPAYNNHLPQTQVILYVSDTMAIAKDDTKFMAADYLHDAYNFFAIQPTEFEIIFKGYNTDYEITYPMYSIRLAGTLDEPDHTPFTMSYDFMMAFLNSAGQPYTPENEELETALRFAQSPAPQATKQLINGQLFIRTADGRLFTTDGRPARF